MKPQPITKLGPAWCAGAIMDWHLKHGRQKAAKVLSEEALTEYLGSLDKLSGLDLLDPAAQWEVARAELSGNLEWSFAVAIPKQWLNALGLAVGNAPQELGGAARLAFAHLDQQRAPPAPDTDSAAPLERYVVARHEVVKRGVEFYPQNALDQACGIGSVNLLVSCSLERAQGSDGVTLLAPSVLGLERVEPGSQPGDFLDCLRQGRLRVGKITGES